jgi:hypothetical protein
MKIGAFASFMTPVASPQSILEIGSKIAGWIRSPCRTRTFRLSWAASANLQALGVDRVVPLLGSDDPDEARSRIDDLAEIANSLGN